MKNENVILYITPETQFVDCELCLDNPPGSDHSTEHVGYWVRTAQSDTPGPDFYSRLRGPFESIDAASMHA